MGTRITATAALPGLLLAFCCAANAAEPAKAPVTEVTYGGIKVAIDSVTGKLRPMSEAESAALDRVVMSTQSKAATAGPKRISMPASIPAALQTQRAVRGGGKAMKVPMSEMSHVVATIDASGEANVQHGDGGSIPNAVAPRAMEEVK